jgi:hypothetical protein
VLQVRGFWISGGETSDPSLKAAILDRVVALMKEGVLRAEATRRPLADWRQVMESVASGSSEKFLLTM